VPSLTVSENTASPAGIAGMGPVMPQFQLAGGCSVVSRVSIGIGVPLGTVEAGAGQLAAAASARALGATAASTAANAGPASGPGALATGDPPSPLAGLDSGAGTEPDGETEAVPPSAAFDTETMPASDGRGAETDVPSQPQAASRSSSRARMTASYQFPVSPGNWLYAPSRQGRRKEGAADREAASRLL
jgi:hypothetical protein